MKTNGSTKFVPANSITKEPTVASTWRAVSGGPITDKLLEWPADLFALTEVILERSEVYRFVLSPLSNTEWPPSRIPNWSEAVEQAGREWSVLVEAQVGAVPKIPANRKEVLL